MAKLYNVTKKDTIDAFKTNAGRTGVNRLDPQTGRPSVPGFTNGKTETARYALEKAFKNSGKQVKNPKKPVAR
jgi:hypothetical protein